MKTEEMELAYDEVCNGCDLASRNSSDGGKMPCLNHKLLFMQRTFPVITHNLYEGEWTHTWVDTDRVYQMIESAIEEFSESDMTVTQFMRHLNPKVIQMTREEFEEIPEL